jgi:hypothetical protein
MPSVPAFLRFLVGGVNTNFVTGRLEAKVHVAEVNGVADAEESHA